MCTRQTDRERQRDRKREITPPGEMVTLQSLLLHSPLEILGTHAHVPGVSFKPPGPRHAPRSTTWESSDIAIMLTADPLMPQSNPNLTEPQIMGTYMPGILREVSEHKLFHIGQHHRAL